MLDYFYPVGWVLYISPFAIALDQQRSFYS